MKNKKIKTICLNKSTRNVYIFCISLFYSIFASNLLFVNQAKSEDIMKVIAVVNDAAITSFDLSQRINLAIIIAGLPNTNEIKFNVNSEHGLITQIRKEGHHEPYFENYSLHLNQAL